MQHIVLIGHGMVGQKFLESLADSPVAADVHVTVLCEEPRPAYDRVHLSEFFSGKSADDLSLVPADFFEKTGFKLRLAAKAVAIERRENQVTLADGEVIHYDKLVLATGSYPFVPSVPGRERPHCHVYRTIEDLEGDAGHAASALQNRRGHRRRSARPGMRQGAARYGPGNPCGGIRAAPDGGAGRR